MGGATRLGGGGMPPFVRVTARSFIENLRVTVVWPPEAASQEDPSTSAASQAFDPLAALWRSTPGLGSFPEESWSEVLQLLPGLSAEASSPLDRLDLFQRPSSQLRMQLL